MPSAIEVTDLVVRYGPLTAVDGLTFSSEAGEVLALLGPNGAGKTTTVETLEGYRRPTAGRARRYRRQRCRRRHGQPGGADDGGSGTRDPFRRSARVGGRRPRRLARRPRHRGPTRRVPRRHGSDAGGRGRPHRLAGRPRPAPGRPAGRPATPRGRLPAAHGRLPGTAGSVRGYVAQTRAEVT